MGSQGRLGRPNSSAIQPRAAFSARLRDAQRRAKRGAEAPGQETGARRLRWRVGPLMQSPFALLALVESNTARKLATLNLLTLRGPRSTRAATAHLPAERALRFSGACADATALCGG